MTFEELYIKMLRAELNSEDALLPKFNPKHLDCLLRPGNYPPVFASEECSSCESGQPCVKSCLFDAIAEDKNGKLYIDEKLCNGCGACIEACKNNKLTESRDALAAMRAVRAKDTFCYALIAPAFMGQFTDAVTPGKLRSAFKALGFDGMVEVALFADILTLKEALEFDKNVVNDGDFQLTSCCCPIWIAMIRKIYSELMPHVPGSVSPMIACGRVIKRLYPNALTVFVGPCVAKKSEAREADVAGAVDYVLTFKEMRDIFEAGGIDPSVMTENEKDHSSRAGRIYARAGGVSEAVLDTVNQLNPTREIAVKARCADGVPACREMIEKIKNKAADANFFEGMGCVGGCVGGPKAIIDKEVGRTRVELYGDAAGFRTPLDNQYVLELLKRLGFNSVDDLLNDNEIFTRKF